MEANERLRIAKELQGQACQCGSAKRERQTFCASCYRSLNADTRRDLYRKFGNGYEEAYQSAIHQLT